MLNWQAIFLALWHAIVMLVTLGRIEIIMVLQFIKF